MPVHPRRRRGFLMAVVLGITAVVALLLGALLLRGGTGRTAARHDADRAQARYEATSALNAVLARVGRGQTTAQAAAAVSAATGQTVLSVGDRLLVDRAGGPLLARVGSLAFRHALFGATLDLAGAEGAFREDDPHRPGTGRIPLAEAGFLEAWRTRTDAEGIHLVPQPEECRFAPGGGAWRAEAGPSFLYLGGGGGEALGWVPGVHRWTLADGEWRCTTGERLQPGPDGWTWRSAPGGSTLAGPVLAEGSLEVTGDLRILGTLIVQGGALSVRQGTLDLQPGDSTLALAAVGGDGNPRSWSADRRGRPGDVLIVDGSGRLVVGDPALPEETGALVLADNRFVKNGGRIRLVGVLAASLLQVNGVASGDYTWSSRVGRQPPEGLSRGDASLLRLP